MQEKTERNELRRYFRAQRRSLSAEAQFNNSLDVTRHLLNSGHLLRGKRIGGYWANDGEVDLELLLTELNYRHRRLALPVVSQRGYMSFFHYRPGARLITNRYNIPEPAAGAGFIDGRSLSLVLVPLVAFDECGIRLGMGGGYYDRFLGSLPSQLRPRIIGVAHEVQRSTDHLPRGDWDVALDSVVTECGWQHFG
ncbi:MAG: 5-formyltetrahydrofolate cyclo-ligase [Gammaproteobacteria bacterium]|nr:5-formyltetrahydrofolate cyclo-ligase [Gammaproteobacteria bacterium]